VDGCLLDWTFRRCQSWWTHVRIYYQLLGMALALLGIILFQVHISLIHKVGAIFAGVNAIAFFLFFPEPQYSRDTTYKPTSNTSDTPQEKYDGKDIPSDGVLSDEPVANQKKTFLEELKPFSKIDPNKNYLFLLIRPLPLVIYPATIFGFLVFASSLGFFLAALSVNPSVFQAPPYNMSPAINGLINIPSLIGHIAGSISGGYLTDKIAEWHARRNNGIFEPEARLTALIIPFIITPAGLLM
jgi:hypothetical protein